MYDCRMVVHSVGGYLICHDQGGFFFCGGCSRYDGVSELIACFSCIVSSGLP